MLNLVNVVMKVEIEIFEIAGHGILSSHHRQAGNSSAETLKQSWMYLTQNHQSRTVCNIPSFPIDLCSGLQQWRTLYIGLLGAITFMAYFQYDGGSVPNEKIPKIN